MMDKDTTSEEVKCMVCSNKAYYVRGNIQLCKWHYEQITEEARKAEKQKLIKPLVRAWRFLINSDNYQGARELELIKNELTDKTFKELDVQISAEDTHSPLKNNGSDSSETKSYANSEVVGSHPVNRKQIHSVGSAVEESGDTAQRCKHCGKTKGEHFHRHKGQYNEGLRDRYYCKKFGLVEFKAEEQEAGTK